MRLKIGCIAAIMQLLMAGSMAEETQYFSQAGQDRFVEALCGHGEGGFYLEIGSADPALNNNSLFFEKTAHWKGVSIDINIAHQKKWQQERKNPLVIGDATVLDYVQVLKGFPPVIDYLSLDIDEAYDQVLEQIPLDRYQFKVITIEHDAYRFGDQYRSKEREILKKHGYHLLCADVHSPRDFQFEDWWVHPSAFPKSLIEQLEKLPLNDQGYEKIIALIRESLKS